MKGKIIETAGKTWRVLGEKKEVKVTDLSKLVKEKGEVVFQALGWLAREDKVNYISRKNQTFVSLIDPEFQYFRSSFPAKKAPVKKAKIAVKSRVKKVLKRVKR
ncbi:MAG: winged helix-turn-helix domain-containing protein [Candidatus Aceula lacicola]|nr:winged helix-turn-helix domain-containing protein [Candidatus Aceula lacicola]